MSFRGSKPCTYRIPKKGFTLVELMVVFLILSAMGLGVTQFLKKQQSAMNEAQAIGSNRTQMTLLEKRLREDIQQLVFLNPSCDTNPAPNTTVSTLCSVVQAFGAITPFPAATVGTLDALSTLALPANLEEDPSALSTPYDAVRLLRFDFDGSFSCRLKNRAMNPSTTPGQGSGAERLWVDSDCIGLLEVNRLYIIVEVFDRDSLSTSPADLIPYANLFQVTAIADNPGVESQIDAASLSNIFNQQGGMGLSGFSTAARIFPVKFVEYAYQPDGEALARGIYRREIRPNTGDPLGYGDWQLLDGDADGLQFYPVTVPTSGAKEHNRTMDYDGTALNNGLEDIRGVSPRIVIRSRVARTDGAIFDNPMTATVENDHFARRDAKFFIEMRNTQTAN